MKRTFCLLLTLCLVAGCSMAGAEDTSASGSVSTPEGGGRSSPPSPGSYQRTPCSRRNA